MIPILEEPRSDTSRRKRLLLRAAIFPIVLAALVYFLTRGIVLSRSESTVSEADRLRQMGKIGEARNELSWLLYFDPDCPGAKLVIAQCAHAEGNLSAAIEELRPQFPDSKTAGPAGELLARYLLEDFQMEAAESVLVQLVEGFPDSAFAWEELRWLYFNQFRTRDVESLLLEQLDRGPDRDYVLIHLMMTEFRPPVPREGIGYLESIENRRPGQLPIVRALAFCHWQLGELDQAQTCFERVLQQAPEDPETLLMLAEFALEQNRIEMSRSFVDSLDRLEDETELRADRRHWVRSLLFEREDKLEASLDEAARALELRPFELKYAYQRATLLSRMGRNDEAERAYETARNLESVERRMADLVLSGSLDALTIEQALTIADLYEERNRPRLAEQWRASVDRFRRKAGA